MRKRQDFGSEPIAKDGVNVAALLEVEVGEPDTREVYRAGDLKREFGVTHRALRAYEVNGLLRPVRQGIRRLYSHFDRRRLRLAILSQAFGFTAAEVAVIVDVYGGLRNIGTTAGVSG